MKKYLTLGICIISTVMHACRNTISNNTNTTYKVAEINQNNRDLKKQHYLPDNYLKDEQLAHTLKPGEEVSFGGHYLPTFEIFKEYPDGKWHALLIVKQNECGPRGPENKYLLMTDLLKCKLPDDYDPVYTFVRRKAADELVAESKNTAELTAVANPYQELQNILDETTQKLQELMSRIMEKCPQHAEAVPVKKESTQPEKEQPKKEPAEKNVKEVLPTKPPEENQKKEAAQEKSDSGEKNEEKKVLEGEDGKKCGKCEA